MRICFPVGTILAVKNKYDKLDISGVFEKYKKKGNERQAQAAALLCEQIHRLLSVTLSIPEHLQFCPRPQ